MTKNELTILSMGAGQESAALAHLLVFDKAFRRQYAPGKLLVLKADTGDEHRATPQMLPHLARLESLMTVEYERDYLTPFFTRHGIEYHHITADLGFHGTGWHSLQEQYDRNATCGSKAFPKSCTDRLKIAPFYAFLADWVARNYGPEFAGPQKRGLVRFAEAFGKIDILIGIAAGEERRMANLHATIVKDGKAVYLAPRWRRLSTNVLYPLVDRGMDRASCQGLIRSVGGVVPFPSNCRRCPFMDEIELLWLATFDPATLEEWARQEARKMAANAGRPGRNLTVWGERTLRQKLDDARAKYGHLSEAQLFEHKFSHGHSVKSKY